MGGLCAEVGRYLKGLNRIGNPPPDIHAVSAANAAISLQPIHGFENCAIAVLADQDIRRAIYVEVRDHDFGL